MDGSAFMLATLDCSTKNFTKASAPASVWARAAFGIWTAVAVVVVAGAEVVVRDGALAVDDCVPTAEVDGVELIAGGSPAPPAHPASRPPSSPATTPASTPTDPRRTTRR